MLFGDVVAVDVVEVAVPGLRGHREQPASATTGWCLTVQAMIPACAMPTACVFVIATGPSNVPDSLIQETPVISPLPFWE